MKVITSEKEAQRIVDDLCHKHHLPPIRVTMRKQLDREDLDAEFNDETWTIEFERGISDKVLWHEFFHYALSLIKASEEVEEALSDTFAGLK
jgi:hypothetical protein